MAWEISWVELPGIVSDTISDVDSRVAERFRKAPLSITLHLERWENIMIEIVLFISIVGLA